MQTRPQIASNRSHPDNPRWLNGLAIVGLSFLLLLVLSWLLGGVISLLGGHGPDLTTGLRWVAVGLSIACLASLLAWPLALIAVSVIEQTPSDRLRRSLEKIFLYFSALPLFLYALAFTRVSRGSLLLWLDSVWRDLFASQNVFTQALAFALTLLAYPFSVFPLVAPDWTVDEFYRRALVFLLNFGSTSLVVVGILLCLVFFILPQMVVAMLEELRERDSHRIFEAVQALGGSRWQATQVAVLQVMGASFPFLLTRFMRIAFFEGIITFVMLKALMNVQGPTGSTWLHGLASQFLNLSLKQGVSPAEVFALGTWLVVLYGVFASVESRLSKKVEVKHA